jgi:Flp pilus assembly protein TadD
LAALFLTCCAGVRAADDAEADDVARARLTRILDAEPRNAAVLIELGVLEARTKHLDEAISLLQRATRVDPDSVKAWLALGVAACESGKLDIALAALFQAVLLEPRNAKAHSYLGVTLGRKGWLDGAEAELQRALELDDALAEAHFNLAVVYLQGNPPMVELARRHYQRARDLGASPDSLVENQLKRSKE